MSTYCVIVIVLGTLSGGLEQWKNTNNIPVFSEGTFYGETDQGNRCKDKFRQ